MPPEVLTGQKLVLDSLKLYKSNGFLGGGSGQNKIIPLPGGDNPKTIEAYSDTLAEKLGPDLVGFFTMGKETKIVDGPRAGQPIIDNLHVEVKKVAGVVDVVSLTYRMYDFAVNLSSINLQMPFLQAEITIGDWDTYERNRHSDGADMIDPASVLVPQTYKDAFDHDFRIMMVDGLPLKGNYWVVPYDRFRSRLFRNHIDGANDIRTPRAEELIRSGELSEEDYVPIELREPKSDSNRPLRNLKMKR